MHVLQCYGVLFNLDTSSNDSSVLCFRHYLRGLQNRLQDGDFPVLAPPA